MASPSGTRSGGWGRAELVALLEPPEVAIDHEAMRVLYRDRGEPLGYELWFRPGSGQAGGVGWLEFAWEPRGLVVTRAVSACEPIALARDAGREEEVAAITLRLADLFAETDTEPGRAIAKRLRAEVGAGQAGERVSLRAVQARLVEALVQGESLGSMCRRGGFTDRRGKPDTSWLERRAGLLPTRCNKTGKWRRARTASPPTMGRLARALGLAPAELGV